MHGAASEGIEVACAQPSVLGESPLWDHRIGKLHWVDIRAPSILTLDPSTGITVRRPLHEEVGFIALSPDPGIVIAGLKTGLFNVDLASGQATLLMIVEPDRPENRINDGTVAADGAILFGTLNRNHEAPTGSFWRYYRGKLTSLGGQYTITNGPGVAPDGNRVLTVDSIGRQIFAHSYKNGVLGEAALYVDFPAGHGIPDGLAFDIESHVWVAHYGGSRVSRFKPDGSVSETIIVPAMHVTKCAFGGRDLKTLYITTAAHRRNLADEPQAGCLFKTDVGVAGMPAHIALV